MDLITHILTGVLINKTSNLILIQPLVYVGCVLPDIGEITIQKALARKFGEKLAVYDDRTSDMSIASDLNVTYLYDLFHSPILSTSFILLGFAGANMLPERWGNVLISLGIGLFSHFLLDSFTHGKVWALKLFFPFSNKRYPILENRIGNWWDWQPTIKLPVFDFPFPVTCVFVWAVLIGLTMLINFFLHQNFTS